MARKSKIEEYELESFIDDILFENEDTPHTEIAKLCSKKANAEISNMAITRYMAIKNNTKNEQRMRKKIVASDSRRVLKVVNQEIDIIQTNLDTTKRLIERFALVDDLPELFKQEMEELTNKLVDHQEEWNYVSYIESWQTKFEVELRRKVGEIAILNREVRENMKFIVQLREKAFQFELVQEYIRLFMEIFEEESKDGAYERAVVRIASNPRMKQLAEQQKLYTGGD
jgi:hypothetical protein